MIIERREYALTPCRIADYWQAYEQWNRCLEEEGLIGQTLAFFYTAFGPKNSIVNLSAYDSFEHRCASFARIYRRLSPDYVEAVRPWYVSQESALFEPSSLGEAVFPDPDAIEALRKQVQVDGDAAKIVVVETSRDIRAQGLGDYAKVLGELRAAKCAAYDTNLLGSLQSVSGRLFRMLEYRWFCDAQSAEQYVLTADSDSIMCEAMHQLEPYIGDNHRTYLKVSPLPWLRPMLEQSASAV
jgi:hypothetical protein